MRILSLILCVAVLFFIAACVNDAKVNQNTQSNTTNSTNVADYSALAVTYCECSAPLVELNKKAKNLAEHPELIKNPDELADLLEQSELLRSKQMECQNTLEQQYQTKIMDSREVLAAIRKVCPTLADFMENAKKDEPAE